MPSKRGASFTQFTRSAEPCIQNQKSACCLFCMSFISLASPSEKDTSTRRCHQQQHGQINKLHFPWLLYQSITCRKTRLNSTSCNARSGERVQVNQQADVALSSVKPSAFLPMAYRYYRGHHLSHPITTPEHPASYSASLTISAQPHTDRCSRSQLISRAAPVERVGWRWALAGLDFDVPRATNETVSRNEIFRPLPH